MSPAKMAELIQMPLGSRGEDAWAQETNALHGYIWAAAQPGEYD